MDEAKWLACTDPQPMLVFLRGKVSERKLRLFAVACCRRVVHLLTLEAYRKALDLAERYADQPPHRSRIKAANTKLWKARHGRELSEEEDGAATAVCHCFHVSAPLFAEWAAQNAADALALESHWHAKDSEPDYDLVRAAASKDVLPPQADLVREIIGNPFRSVALDPAWLAWNGGTPVRLAQAAHDERLFDRLPILADALEEAGCTDASLLDHLRGPGPHVRGCWVLDLVLARE